jgi:hypothetical protein
MYFFPEGRGIFTKEALLCSLASGAIIVLSSWWFFNWSLEVFVDFVRQIVQISILALDFLLVQLRFDWLTTYSGVI